MPNLDSEIGDMRESSFFTSVYFPSSFLRLPLHEDPQYLHAFMTDTGVFMPTRTLQGGRNSAQNFHRKVAPCFDEMRHSLKAWIEDFAIRTKTESDFRVSLRTFLCIFHERNLKVLARKKELFPQNPERVWPHYQPRRRAFRSEKRTTAYERQHPDQLRGAP